MNFTDDSVFSENLQPAVLRLPPFRPNGSQATAVFPSAKLSNFGRGGLPTMRPPRCFTSAIQDSEGLDGLRLDSSLQRQGKFMNLLACDILRILDCLPTNKCVGGDQLSERWCVAVFCPQQVVPEPNGVAQHLAVLYAESC